MTFTVFLIIFDTIDLIKENHKEKLYLKRDWLFTYIFYSLIIFAGLCNSMSICIPNLYQLSGSV
jgi:hypothetical protein